MGENTAYDVIIIGAGPAGNTAALYTARAGLRTLVLDRPGRSGALARAEWIANFPGVPGDVSGADLLSRMRAQAEGFGASYVTGTVSAVALAGDPKTVYDSAGGAYTGHAVLIATGALERKHRVPGEEEFLGRGVSVCATCDGAFYREKTVIVAGNDDCAAEEALALARFTARQSFLLPGHQTSISPELLAALEEHPGIDVRYRWAVKEIRGDTAMRTVLVTTPEGETVLAADGIFMLLCGATPTTGFLYGAVATDDTGAILVNPGYGTSVPRVYAVGDVVAGHPARQAIVSAGAGCLAALAVERDLRGRARLKVDYHKQPAGVSG